MNLKKYWMIGSHRYRRYCPDILKVGVHETTKALHLFWDFWNDRLTYSISFSRYNLATKRIILSDVSQTFDLLGLLGPLTYNIRQEFVSATMGSKTRITLYQKWAKLLSELAHLTSEVCESPLLLAKLFNNAVTSLSCNITACYFLGGWKPDQIW